MIALPFLKNAQKKEILAVTCAICAVIFVIYCLVLVRPLFIRLRTVVPQASRLSLDLDRARGDIDRMSALTARTDDLAARIEAYRRRFPTEEEFPALLESLSDRARASNVKIVKIVPESGGAPADAGAAAKGNRIFDEQEILVYAVAGYHQLGSFIFDLESGERFMEIADVKIESSKRTPSRHDVQMVVKTFILNPEADR